MERGPLPPHERTWRHPSELAAEERALVLNEPAPRNTRAAALATGTLGLLAVGLLVLTITPKRAESPVAISASTTPQAQAGVRRPVALVSTAAAAPDSSNATSALATPIGDGRFAIVTREAVAQADRSLVDIRLPSGRESEGEIVTASDDAVIVALSSAEPGHDIAHHRPNRREMVTVMASPPITVAYEDVDTLNVDEGTPVLDSDGRLVGICSQRAGTERVRLVEVITALDDATSVVP